MSEIQGLKEFLTNMSPGPIPEEYEAELIRLLKNSWSTLNPDDSEDLYAYKLDRLEEPSWRPPFLTFIVERHGGMALGSTRAELQLWTVDTNRVRINDIKSSNVHAKMKSCLFSYSVTKL